MMASMHSITILGVRVDDVTLNEAVAQIESFIAARTPLHIVTVNPEFVMEAQRNAPFAAVLRDAALAVPDGVGLNLVTRWQKTASAGTRTRRGSVRAAGSAECAKGVSHLSARRGIGRGGTNGARIAAAF